MSGFDFDAVVVGAGAVGLACGYALSRRGRSVLVIEKGDGIGEGVSSRNSEVIHAGLYYPTGSLKARLCVTGRRLMYNFLDDHGVAYERCGKLVVATEADEIGRLDAIASQAEANDVEGVTRLTASQVHALEPEVKAVEGLLSAQSGIFDSHGFMLALQGEIENAAGVVVMNTPFAGADPLPGGGWRVRTGGDAPATVTASRLVVAAGLGAQAAAASIVGFPSDAIPELHYGKGSYFLLHGKPPFTHLVYPPPIPGALGVHYKRDLGGQAHFGPDLEYVAHEDYQVKSERAEAFYAYIRRFWPALPDGALSPDYAGIRPKLHGPGEPQPDFDIAGVEQHGLEGLMALFGIESPGLTSSLAIGEEVAQRLANTE
jgi:L-2-hydroxyglutarate oxidase LhgO